MDEIKQEIKDTLKDCIGWDNPEDALVEAFLRGRESAINEFHYLSKMKGENK